MSSRQIQHDTALTPTPIVPVHASKKSSSFQQVPRKPIERRGHLQPLRKKDTVLSCRYELKYRIPETKARALAAYLQSYISPDPYARNKPNYEYLICSLYYDSDGLDLCRETIEQKVNRFKLRVRFYDDDPQTPCFFEIKRRLNGIILKDRARLSKSMFVKASRELYLPGDLWKKDRDALCQFQFYLRALQAHPVVLVRYHRQAFEDDTLNRVRITFDRQLTFKTVSEPVLSTNGGGWQRVPMDFVVLEIKFTNRYPAWLNDMVKIFDLKQSAMSKYVSSIQQSCSMGFCGPRCHLGI